MNVMVVDFNTYRLGMAQKLGADVVLSPDDPGLDAEVQSWTEAFGLDAVYESAGEEAAAE